MINYIYYLASSIPLIIYVLLFVITIIGGALFLVKYGVKEGKSKITILLTFEYIFLLYSSTILFRNLSEIRRYNFHPFWSYENFGYHSLEISMNIIVFIPLGFLIGVSYNKVLWQQVLILGSSVSIGIEFMQFILRRGFSEIDDIIHNTIGCLIGFGLFKIMNLINKKYSYNE